VFSNAYLDRGLDKIRHNVARAATQPMLG
jgi:hypothetical protein